MERFNKYERSIITTYRKEIWRPFIKAVKEYELIKDGDKIAVCISGGKDSMLLAKCMQELYKYGKQNFSLEFICMDPGYNAENYKRIVSNAKLIDIPVNIFKSDIFQIVDTMEDKPCYLCARMRRGCLYTKAQSLGCNKIALGHHFNDVVETILMGLMYNGQYQGMMPKLHSDNFDNMELIRPLYKVREQAIINWSNHNNLEFINCACRFTSKDNLTAFDSKRKEMKKLTQYLMTLNPQADYNIFNSVHNVNMDTCINWKKDKLIHSFLDEYDK